MTGEQKPGGLEVVAWRWKVEGMRGWNVSPHADIRVNGAFVEPLTPAEPAEARIRELSRRRDDLLAGNNRYLERARAAEAKLARAVEGLERIAGEARPITRAAVRGHAAEALRQISAMGGEDGRQ